jgi:hypothetical protein
MVTENLSLKIWPIQLWVVQELILRYKFSWEGSIWVSVSQSKVGLRSTDSLLYDNSSEVALRGSRTHRRFFKSSNIEG